MRCIVLISCSAIFVFVLLVRQAAESLMALAASGPRIHDSDLYQTRFKTPVLAARALASMLTTPFVNFGVLRMYISL